MQKTEELSNPNSCLNKAADDELLFVIRAQDESASNVVRFWAILNSKTLAPEKYKEAMNWADKVEDWQQANPDRVKKPD